jgi:predicted amidohydrolase
MSSKSIAIGVAQITSSEDVDANLAQIKDAYGKAVHLGAAVVVFPENSLFLRVRSGSSLQGLAPKSRESEAVQALVEHWGVPLMLTTPSPVSPDSPGQLRPSGKLFNSTFLFRRGNPMQCLYSKIHLFDVDVAGAPQVRESDHFLAGTRPAQIQLAGWTFGLTICYDLRFADLFLHYAQTVDAVLIPSSFLVPTGMAHWQILLQARAIESQCFVVAPAQCGEHRVEGSDQVRQTYGHSLVVDPWGKILLDMGEASGVQVVQLEREGIDRVRRQIPMEFHRRLGAKTQGEKA